MQKEHITGSMMSEDEVQQDGYKENADLLNTGEMPEFVDTEERLNEIASQLFGTAKSKS